MQPKCDIAVKQIKDASIMINKDEVLQRTDKRSFYKFFIPSLKENGKVQAIGLCPFHDDHHPSLSVNLDNGYFNCFACKEKGDIFTFYQKIKGVDFKTAFKEIAEMQGIVEDKPKVVATFEYKDEDGKTLYIKERVEPGRDGRDKEFFFKHRENDRWEKSRGCDSVLYNLPEVVNAKRLIFVEGEGKVEFLKEWGLTATCLDAGANSPWRKEYTKYIEGKEEITILPDNDKAGIDYAFKIANTLHGKVKTIKVVELQGLQEKGDIIDWGSVEGNDKEKLIDIINKKSKWIPSKEDDIVDLVDIVGVENKKTDKILLPLQPFPLEVFPESLVGIIKRFSNSLGVETEVIGSSMITIVSSAIGNTVRVSPKYGYDVPVFIWLIIIATSGYGKTPAISTLVKPTEKRQSKTYREYREKLKRYKESLRKHRRGETTETVDEPILEHFFASDTTVEALGDIFENNPRGILIYRDELAGLILGLNQYKGGAGNDRQHYLELFNCNSWKIDRKTGVKFIPNVGASIIGGIQTTTMPKIFKLDAIGEGLLPRYLLQNTEYKPRKFQRQGIDPNDLNLWSEILEKCYEIPLTLNDSGFVEPKVLILEEEALILFETFHNNYTNLILYLSDNAKPFVPKFITYSLKMAGILHILEGFSSGHANINNLIKPETMNRAIRLTEYYAGQSINALQLYGTNTKKELNTLESKLLKVVFSLETEVKNGKLALIQIRDRFNVDLPEPLQRNSKQIGAMLRKLGLETMQSTNGYYFLLWEDDRMKKLKTTSTKSTISTETYSFPGEIPQKVDVGDILREDNFIDLENEEVEILNEMQCTKNC